MNAARKLILVTQPVLMPIDDAAAIEALPDFDRWSVRYPANIDTTDAAKRATANGDWVGVRDAITAEHNRVLAPLMRQHKEARLAYWGTAPIPAAVYLGYLVGTWPAIDVFQRHHELKNWRWPAAERSRQVSISSLPSTASLAAGDVIIRVSTTRLVNRDETLAVVSAPLAEIDIRTDTLGADALAHVDDVEEVARAFRRVLDVVGDSFPRATTIHLFASVPGGLAFRLGNIVSLTQHADIQTYQYDINAAPRHRQAIRLRTRDSKQLCLSAEARERTVEIRARFDESLADLRHHISSPNVSDDPLATLRHPAPSTTVVASKLIVASSSGPGFEYDREQRAWRLDDQLVDSLSKEFSDDERLMRSLRMLLFHESIHELAHGLTGATSNQVWRHPGILEQVDFEADVWAAAQEFQYSRQRLASPATSDVELWKAVLQTIGATFRAFDAPSLPFDTIEPRRLSRYLIWSWQQLRLERCNTTAAVVAVLSDKPQLELGGLPATVVRERPCVELTDRGGLLLAVRHRRQLHRFGSSAAHNLADLVAAIRVADCQKMKRALRGPFDQILQSAPSHP